MSASSCVLTTSPRAMVACKKFFCNLHAVEVMHTLWKVQHRCKGFQEQVQGTYTVNSASDIHLVCQTLQYWADRFPSLTFL